MQPAKWPSLVFRVFGAASVLFAISGALATVCDVTFFGMHWMGRYSAAPYMLSAFWAMIAMNLVFEICLAIAGIWLWQLRTQGLTICNVLFPAEILYFLVISVPRFPGVTEGLRLSITSAANFANAGSVLQWVTGFPLIALVALNVAARRRVSLASV